MTNEEQKLQELVNGISAFTTRKELMERITALISEHYTANEEVKKMVKERLREELIRYIKWYGGFNYENMTDEMLVNEYLNTRER